MQKYRWLWTVQIHHPIFHHVLLAIMIQKKDKMELSWPEQLNNDCNVPSGMHLTPKAKDTQAHPITTSGSPSHLQIQGKIISHCLQHTLCNSATRQQNMNHLMEKFQWPLDSYHYIDWQHILFLALN